MLIDYTINSRVTVQITGSIPSGLLGRVEDGPKAIIRNREIAWGARVPVDAYVGQVREAIVVGYNPAYEELELSLRLAERDPWEHAEDRYRPGREVQGRVVGLTERGAFVELEPGVEGYLPRSALPLDDEARIEDWLWIEDRVKAIVSRVDVSRRRMGLNVRALLERREAEMQRRLWASADRSASNAATLAELLPTDVRLRLLRLGGDAEAIAGPPLQALIVEDDETFAAGLESLLQRNGCQVTRTADAIAGLSAVREQGTPFDLVLLDLNLPGPKGHQLVRQLQEESPSSYLAMVLEPAPLHDQPEAWARLRESGVDVYSKGDGDALRDGLLAVLRALRDGKPVAEPGRTRHFPEAAIPRVAPGSPEDEGEREAPPLLPEQQATLDAALERLAYSTGADVAVLLRLEPGQRRPEVEGASGAPFPIEQAPPDLIHSPLKDVLQRGQEICERVPPDSRKFERLLALRPFRAFLGMPVPPVGAAHYGLVLLKDQGAFTRTGRREASNAAYLIAGILQERRLSHALQPWQAQNLIGRLISSAIHEINNKLGAIQFIAEGLHEDLRDLARWPEKAKDATLIHSMEEAVEQILSAQREASLLRDQYLSLTASDEPQAVDLDELGQGIARVLRADAQRHNVILKVRAATGVPPVDARPSQLRQIYMNLILNAIQQMADLGQHSTLTVDLSYHPGAQWPVQVRFADSGPGAHYQLWERIFDFGFTTRSGGAGLGLTISRQIATSLGGRLRVLESYILWGTTFVLELPEGSEHAGSDPAPVGR
ncbi:MAG: response regulator [Anaerolineae bacterium]|nr:response regulator [Anaerolineae bacterium]